MYDMFSLTPKSQWLSQKWGKIRVNPEFSLPEAWSEHSKQKIPLLCDCGKTTFSLFGNVTKGGVTSCGRCTYIPKVEMLRRVWGTLKLNSSQPLPDEIPPSSGKSFLFDCSCGKTLPKKLCDIACGRIVSCGHCNDMPIEFWLSKSWGEYSLCYSPKLPPVLNLMSNNKYLFRCSCGRETRLKGSWVVSGNTRSCGKCYWKPKTWWFKQRWGSLKLDPKQRCPEEWGTGYSSPLKFLCDCTRSKATSMFNVISGKILSCGHCKWKSKAYWLAQTWGQLRIDSSQPLPDEWGVSKKIQLLCDCGGHIHSNLFNVIKGRTVSCGCSKGTGLNSPETKLRETVKLLYPDTLPTAYQIPGSRKTYDIYVPSLKLAIEYHGLIWHSERYQTSRLADRKKYELACKQGDRLIQIYADEWNDRPEVIKNLVLSFSRQPRQRITPEYILALDHTPVEARSFLDSHHYLGAASGCITVIANHRNTVVGVWVFMKREDGTLLWHRACVHPSYKMWNPHERALKLAIPEARVRGFNRILTFSDNRYHTGNLYVKLGFIFEKEIAPDYAYTNGVVRKSKYAFRVKAGVNEEAAARSKGWYRIWDSGKHRYVLPL